MSTTLSKRWHELHDHYTDTDPSLRLVSKRFEEVIAHVEVMFQQSPGDIERGLDVLSDGQQSLFYFALAAAVFDLERDAVADSIKGFRADELRIPALSIFGIEEPENHLSPYFLSRIVAQVRSMVSGPTAQALITSHSPAVLSRVEPVEVRYCRCAGAQRTSSVKAIAMPAAASDAAKFVRGAVLAFPELYFARFVVLVEGDSERIILPRLAAAEGLVVDPSFVAIVPIGGRHVQHFWRLLKGLSIPYATLLDLDLGRSGGGFGRVKTVTQHLLDAGIPRSDVLTLNDGKVMADGEFKKMHEWDSSDAAHLAPWVNDLKNQGVFCSEPLDLDMAMLAAYPDAYKAIIPKEHGPAMKPEDAAKVVLGEDGPGIDIYKDALAPYKDLMPAYRYHFLTRSKPATHLQAFATLDDKAIEKGMPEVYRALIEHIRSHLTPD
jgi:putative ATP-dependent endonuclease of the OLD family